LSSHRPANAPPHQARNERRWAAAYFGKTSGFEAVHGLLDRVMLMLKVPFVPDGPADGYYIEELSEPTFFPGRAAAVMLREGGSARRVGEFGVLHPSVLEAFGLKYVASVLEVNLEVFL
jgi:phenylalanyl-tRNA synthetase beta chain